MSLFEHFRPEERPFIERALEWMEQAEQYHRQRLTDFLDPRQLQILKQLQGKYQNINCTWYGGYEGAERCRALIHQVYDQPVNEEYEVTIFRVTTPSGSISQLKHKDVLGSLLGIGIKREKFGDIVFDQEQIYIAVAREIADYVRLHLNQMHRLQVLLEEVNASQAISVSHQWKIQHITVPSTRADVIVGDVYNLSRAKVLPPIRGGHLKVNWMIIENPAHLLKAGDIISLRGYGRFKIFAEEGVTKKGKTRLEIGILQ